MSWLIRSFGSKKLVAALAAVLAVFGVLLARKLGLQLEAENVTTVLVAILTPLVGYLMAQWHVDVKTDGKTTTAYQLTLAAAQAAATALPTKTVGAELARAIVQAFKDDAAAEAAAVTAGPSSASAEK
jgi:hypothetical protein